jgi:hypothetical protein
MVDKNQNNIQVNTQCKRMLKYNIRAVGIYTASLFSVILTVQSHIFRCMIAILIQISEILFSNFSLEPSDPDEQIVAEMAQQPDSGYQ